MLELIFSSKTRVKILNLLLLSPEKKYTLSFLVKNIKIPLSSIHRELANLEKIGLIKKEFSITENKKKSENQSFYSADTTALLHEELKALFAKAQVLFSDKFVDGLKKVCHPKFLALTGSLTNYPEAQTDILLVGSVRRSSFLKLITAFEHDLGREVNFTIFSEDEFNYRLNVMDIFLYTIIDGKSLTLINNLKN